MRSFSLTRTFAFFLAAVAPFATGIVRGDPTAYMVNGAGTFGTIDLDTGAFTLVGSMGQRVSGLGEAGGKLFATNWEDATGTLYAVNPANGSLSSVGNSGIAYDDLGSTLTGLYATGVDNNLYSLNATTGAATLIGATGLTIGDFVGLSDNSGTLYYADGTNLYTLSTTTGAATLLGPLGTDSAELGALIQEGSTLYGGQELPTVNVDTVNPMTGAATQGPALSGVSGNFWGLAAYPVASSTSVPDSPLGWVGGAAIAALLALRCWTRLSFR
jgi:hypothetical protein